MQKLFEHFAAVAMSKFTFPTPDPTVKTEDAMTDKGTKVRIYTPDGYKGGKPVCLYYHGGGWAMGNIDGDDPISRAISKSGDIVVVSVEYGLAPDNAHPGLMNECFHALQWALQNAKRLNTAEDKFLTSGFSAGGQIAFGTALMAVDQGLGDLVGVACMVPCTVHPDGVPDELKAKYTTMDKFAHMTINTAPAMRGFWGISNAYFPTSQCTNHKSELFGAPPTDPYGSPLLHPRIKDLKRVYMAIAGLDTLRDDGLLMKEKLDQAG